MSWLTGTSVNTAGGVTITFQGAATGLFIPAMTSNNPIATVVEVTAGGTIPGRSDRDHVLAELDPGDRRE